MKLESLHDDLKASVAIVGYGGGSKWLLGLYKTGDRKNKWCFPGGNIENYETPKQCAQRECLEETGVNAKPIKELCRNNKVAYWYCEASSIDVLLTPNSEYSELKWLTASEALALDNLYELNRDYLIMARKEV